MRDKVPVLFGEVLFDCFEDGSRVLGGAPFNAAWHLQAFGCQPLFISRVGDDPWGRKIRDTMQQWGMTTVGLQKDPEHTTGEVQVSLDRGQPSFEILADRAYDYIQSEELPSMNPSLVYHGTLGLRQAVARETLADLLQRYPATVFMDVNLRPPWWERDQVARLLDRARWVKINDAELKMLVDEGDDLQTKASTLMHRHDLTWVIVTQGAMGAFAVDPVGNIHTSEPATQIQVVDTVGAGDAFASVCILGLLRDWPLAQTLERAQQFASLLVGQRGATIPDMATYQPFIQAWQLAQA
jgi:fructokinase